MIRFLLTLTAFLLLSNTAQSDVNIHSEITTESGKLISEEIKSTPLGSTIYISIDTVGGLIEEAVDIVMAMKGRRTICLADKALSAGMFIFQNCTIRVVKPNALLMIHNIQLVFPKETVIDYSVMKEEIKLTEQLNTLMLSDIAYRMKANPAILSNVISKTKDLQLVLSGYLLILKTNAADYSFENMKELKKVFK